MVSTDESRDDKLEGLANRTGGDRRYGTLANYLFTGETLVFKEIGTPLSYVPDMK
jgi:hypothetical protein